MRFTPSKRALVIAAAAVAITGSGVVVAAVASASDSPSIEELLRDCNTRTDFCEFTITSQREILGRSEQVSDRVLNCSPSEQSYEQDWAETTGSKVSVSLEIGGEYGFTKVFSMSFKVTTGYEWEKSKTVTSKAPIKVASGSVGWLERAPSMNEVTGDYELHYGSRKSGHYYWYVRNVTFTVPTKDAKGNLIQQVRPMTGDERSTCVTG